MHAPVRGCVPCFTLVAARLSVLAIALSAAAAGAQPPAAHHPGAWTPAAPWPGRTSFANSVWAVHMALVQGDTLFARPHSQVMAWSVWGPAGDGGGLWAWNPTTDAATAAAANLTPLAIATPPANVFCAGHAALPNGDLLIVGGMERTIVGEKRSVRFRHQDRQWVEAPMTSRRWYGNATTLADGRVLATGGWMYDHMVLFGGRRQSDGAVVSDVQRYGITNAGDWDPPLTGSGSGWPEAREGHTLADQANGPYYLFGGMGTTGPRNDVWQLRLNDNETTVPASESYAWAPITVAGPPPARWHHAAVVDKKPRDPSHSTMFVFGGEDAGGTALGDLWKLEWNAAQARWQWIQITNASGDVPAARFGHTAVWDESNSRMILFGGQDAGGAIADANVYVLSFPAGHPQWKIARLAAGSPAGPAARTLHAMAADAQSRTPPQKPGAWFHAVVFGGQRVDGLSNDLWELFVQPGTDDIFWIPRTPSGAGPAPRRRASMIVYDEYPVSAVVLGGELAGGGSDSSPWELPLLPNQVWTAHTPLAQGLSGHTAFREQRQLTALQPEVYDPATDSWSPFGPLRFQFSYSMMFLASDGKLYYAGPNYVDQDKTWQFDPTTQTWLSTPFASNATNPLDDTGTGVLYRPNRIMKCGDRVYAQGGIPDYSRPPSEWLQIDEPAPQWRAPVNAMGLRRRDLNLNLLPTGEVIATGGEGALDNSNPNPNDDVPCKRPEIWDPEYTQGGLVGYWYGAGSGESIRLDPEPVTRGHHHSSVLLPDGRILSAGGLDPHPDSVKASVDQYSPPYLFTPAGTPAFRPRLYGAQEHVTWDQDFKVACPDPVAEACLIRPGASTHAFNHDNRYVPLSVISQVGHRVTLHSPASGNVAPPGNYLLFVLTTDPQTGKRVPSIARWVNVGATQTTYATWDTLPPAPVNDLLVTAVTSTSYALQWTAPADAGEGGSGRATRYELRYRSGAPMATADEFFTAGTSVAGPPTPAAPGTVQTLTVTGLTPGSTYYFRLISRDGAGAARNWSDLSNQANHLAALPPAPPGGLRLRPMQPNPFAASTTLQFDLPAGMHVCLEVLDPQGRRVRTLADQFLAAGPHSIEWDGRTDSGGRAGPGAYFYRFQSGDFRVHGRMTRVP